MKTFFIYSLLLLMGFQIPIETNNKKIFALSEQNQSHPLDKIQQRIYNAFVEATIKNNSVPMDTIERELERVNLSNQQNLICYWRSYLNYYKAIYYLKIEDKKASEALCDEAIEWLNKLEKKNSEDYALLAMIQSFGIQFKGFKAMFISSKIKKNAKKAIALNPNNLRAHYVFASNDFYTPAKYGGGKQAEKFLLKAISLPSQEARNPYIPSWGKEEAYTLLVKHYIKVEDLDTAKRYFKEGIKLYPESYNIQQLASKLLD